jgi:hypothetical protein
MLAKMVKGDPVEDEELVDYEELPSSMDMDINMVYHLHAEFHDIDEDDNVA